MPLKSPLSRGSGFHGRDRFRPRLAQNAISMPGITSHRSNILLTCMFYYRKTRPLYFFEWCILELLGMWRDKSWYTQSLISQPWYESNDDHLTREPALRSYEVDLPLLFSSLLFQWERHSSKIDESITLFSRVASLRCRSSSFQLTFRSIVCQVTGIQACCSGLYGEYTPDRMSSNWLGKTLLAFAVPDI